MATVYRAYDQRLGVPRAIKVMLPAYAEKPRVRARFEAEARTMAVLDHPSIVRVYDVGSNDETAWIVMELVISLQENRYVYPVSWSLMLNILSPCFTGLLGIS